MRQAMFHPYSLSQTYSTSVSRRLLSIAVALGVQALFIFAIAAGLVHHGFLKPNGPIVIEFYKDLDKTPPTTPPPAPVIENVPVVDVPAPVVSIETETSTVISDAITVAKTPTTIAPLVPAHLLGDTPSKPPYPPISRRLGEEGNVLLRVTIAEDGSVRDVQLEKSSGYRRLDEAAVLWVKDHWRYSPATQSGNPVVSVTTEQFTFVLK